MFLSSRTKSILSTQWESKLIEHHNRTYDDDDDDDDEDEDL